MTRIVPRVNLERLAVPEVQPRDHDELVSGVHAMERARECRIDLEPGIGRALGALLRRGRRVAQGRVNVSDGTKLHVSTARSRAASRVGSEMTSAARIVPLSSKSKARARSRRPRGARISPTAPFTSAGCMK